MHVNHAIGDTVFFRKIPSVFWDPETSGGPTIMVMPVGTKGKVSNVAPERKEGQYLVQTEHGVFWAEHDHICTPEEWAKMSLLN